MSSILSALYRLVLGLWVGGMSAVTFLVTPILFRTQGPEGAGAIVGRLFPVYFRLCLGLTVVALGARAAAGEAFGSARRLAGTLLIAACIAVVSYHTFALAPRMQALRQTFAAADATPPDTPERREFMRLHGVSMTLNLAVLAAGAVLILWYDSFRR